VEIFANAALNAAVAILRTGGSVDQARQLADAAYGCLAPDSPRAQDALRLLQDCRQSESGTASSD
jgi:hypothetical protein